jgi:hypothetical protein
MHAPAYDFRPLDEYDNRFLDAVARHLTRAKRSEDSAGELREK